MEKHINNNGYEYIDLGLPSGTLWATMNVGASKPSGYGLYFQWGDTKGYTKDQVGKDKQFNFADYKWGDYKWYLSYFGRNRNFSKYTTSSARLDLEDDAANANLGGDWHMPTPEQIQELIDNTTSEWTESDGVVGMTFASKKDSSKSIFIPAAGYAWDGIVGYNGLYGYIWSSMLSAEDTNYGQYLSFNLGYVYLYGYKRYYGRSVRGVIG